MKSLLVVIACLASVAAGAADGYYPPRNNPYYETEVRHGQRFGFTDSNPFAQSALRTRVVSSGMLADGLESEITRLEMLLGQGTPEPTGRFGEVTARFGPLWSPYYQAQILAIPDQGGQMPTPNSPEAQELIVEMAGRVLRRHQALLADQLLALYELRALRRLADQGLSPAMVGAQLARNQEWMAARPGADSLPTMAGSAVKVASFYNPAGYLLPRNGGPQVLDIRTFTPDSPQNIVLLISIRAILQKLDNSPTTASVSVEMEIPGGQAGLHETVAGPTIHIFPDDPTIVQRGSSSLSMTDDETSYGALRDQPRYTLYLVTPQGAAGGSVKVSHILVRVYYITGGFIEAGTIK